MEPLLQFHQDFEKEIPYLFPELYFRDQFGVFLYHLGITMENVKVSSVYALPLFEEQDVGRNWNSLPMRIYGWWSLRS